jgi:trimethylamine:corrinoid methyltransferase-like protein
MHTGRYASSADLPGLQLALREMARYYHVPVNMSGVDTASSELDAQYGHEATAACLLSYLAGADEIYSVGLLGSAQILSLEKMVLDNHLIGQLETTTRPVPVDEAHLQADLIERVGIGGHFLKERETRTYTRKEYIPVWPPADKSMVAIAREEAMQILHSHTPPALPAGAADRIEEIVDQASRTLKT